MRLNLSFKVYTIGTMRLLLLVLSKAFPHVKLYYMTSEVFVIS